MAHQGDKITNTRTLQRMVFLETGKETDGKSLKIETFNPPSEHREPMHIHPKQESSAEVISGKLVFNVDGQERIVGPGENIVVPAGTPHCFWNEGNEEAHAIQNFTPALHLDEFFESYFALANDDKVNEEGMPSMLQLSLLALKHKKEIRVTNPPWPIQALFYTLLAPISLLLGYKARYKSKS